MGRTSARIQVGWTKPKNEKAYMGFTAPVPEHELKTGRRSRRKAWMLDDEESHLVTIAPTGFGKGRSAIIPTCLEYPGSMVVIDPKGEAAAVTARRRRELGNDVVVIDPFKVSTDTPDTFNPFDVMKATDLGIEEFSLLFPTLLHPDSKNGGLNDPFWNIKGDDLIAGITAMILSAIPEEERDIITLRKKIKSGDVIYGLAQALDTLKEDMSPMAYESISALVSTDDRCRSSILATAQQYFSIFSEPNVIESLSSTSFDITQFRDADKPMTVFLVLPVTKLESHGALLRIWLSSLLAVLKCRKKRPDTATLLMIDEAAQLGKMNSLLECMTLLRGFGVRTWTFWQSQKQLYKLYGDDADVILDNCGVLQTLGCNHMRNAIALSELIGGECPAQKLLTLPQGDQVVMTRGGVVETMRTLDYLKDKKYKGQFDVNPFYENSAWSIDGARPSTRASGR